MNPGAVAVRPLEPESYFEHGADFGIVGRSASVEGAFVSAAQALFALVTDPASVMPAVHVAFTLDEPDVELALVRWLNLLLAYASDRHLALGRFALRRDGDAWHGEAWGEPWRRGLERGTDVKGATLTMLSVKPFAGGWEARCVVDA